MSEYTKTLFEYHDLIEAIVLALENRDMYTLHHSRRVSNMTEYICRAIDLPAEQTELYHIAADLHDIGKIGICDAVLLKEGSLTDEEWKQMRAHSEIGGEILSKVERFHDISVIVRAHHERWDGKGYPDVLAGDDIPFGARAIAIADSIDAMLSNRSYRNAMSEEKCHEQIAKNSGIMYDPTLVTTVLAHWNEVLAARLLERN